MAEAAADNMDQFHCSVCLDPLRKPVTIPCGHNYCLTCINGYWNTEDQKGVYSCPQCRETFRPRPDLRKNTMLAELVEKMKKTAIQTAYVPCYAGPGDVECDLCTSGRKLKAVKSCVVCLVSMCETHIQPHYDVPAFKKHKLVTATSQLKKKLCAKHDQPLELFCRTDQTSICMSCSSDDHKDHETISAAAERAKKQKNVGKMKHEYQLKIKDTAKKLQELRKAMGSHKRSIRDILQFSERIFTELLQCIERKRSEVKELILAQQKLEVSQAEVVLKDLEQKITELKKGDAELTELLREEDHVHFLQRFHSVQHSTVLQDSPLIIVTPKQCFEDLRQSLSTLRQRVEEVCKKDTVMISKKVKEVVITREEPKTREDFLQYFCQLTLDPNTISDGLSLEEGKRKSKGYPDFVTCDHPYHPERFVDTNQVLCEQGLSGRCYWETVWGYEDEVIQIGVAYKNIKRRGNGRYLGRNDLSWRLSCKSIGCHLVHNSIMTKIPSVPGNKIGVYLDHKAGTLSFYNVSDTMVLLHTVETKFTEPLYPAFWLDEGGTLKLCSAQDD